MSKRLLKEWEEFYSDSGIDPKVASVFLNYVEDIVDRGYPPIFEYKHLAKLMEKTEDFILSVIHSPESHYRNFEIPKRSGGKRKISVPYPALLDCQHWIKRNILSRIPIHSSAHGFAEKKSILSNASPHLAAKQVLKLDIQDFFPSILKCKVIHIFMRCGYPQNVAFYLAQLCCQNNALPQGGACSPSLSNIVAWRLDKRLHGLAVSHHLKYTRYADDMTFSGNSIAVSFISYASAIVRDEGFNINETKTRLSKYGGKRIVTGISVKGNVPKIPKKYKRKLRQEVYYVLNHGFRSHMSKRKIRDPYFLRSILGKVSHWLWVEPDNKFAKNALPRLKALAIQ